MKIIMGLLLACFLCAPLNIHAGSPASTAQEWAAEGDDNMAKGKTGKAVDCYIKAVLKDRKNKDYKARLQAALVKNASELNGKAISVDKP